MFYDIYERYFRTIYYRIICHCRRYRYKIARHDVPSRTADIMLKKEKDGVLEENDVTAASVNLDRHNKRFC